MKAKRERERDLRAMGEGKNIKTFANAGLKVTDT
jgi:hypothetical protein